MSAADTILFALKAYIRRDPDANTEIDLNTKAVNLLARYDAELLAETKATGRLRDFTVVWTRSDGSDVPATELRCVLCNGLVQGVGPHTLLDLNTLADQHNCQKGAAK